MLPYVRSGGTFATSISPVDEPECGALLPIQEIFERLSTLVGLSFVDHGMDQERNRNFNTAPTVRSKFDNQVAPYVTALKNKIWPVRCFLGKYFLSLDAPVGSIPFLT